MWLARFPASLAAAQAPGLGAAVWIAEDGSEACAYLPDAPRDLLSPEVSLVRLGPLQALAGEAHGRDARWHYVVATDVLPAQEADFNAWYNTEHLPGLAAVPGVVRAARYRVLEGGGPAYHAGYDLADRVAFNSAPWLAVRATAWSSRVRPAFCQTRRTMYRRLD
jgi:hypothetical protein